MECVVCKKDVHKKEKIEDLTISVIIEFLRHKGLRKTLKSFENETCNKKPCVHPRALIIEELHLKKAFKRNKESQQPFKSLLEIITCRLLDKAHKKKVCQLEKFSSISSSNSSEVRSAKQETKKFASSSLNLKGHSILKKLHRTSLSSLSCNINLIATKENFQLSETNRNLHTTLKSLRLKRIKTCDIANINLKKCDLSSVDKVIANICKSLRRNDINSKMSALSLTETPYFSEDRQITIEEACHLRLLLFGNTQCKFSEAWSKQGFVFNSNSATYGLSQRRSGPCGVLAAVQAYVLYELLFGYSRCLLSSGKLKPDFEEVQQALSRALTDILWQAGEFKIVMIAVKGKHPIYNNATERNVLRGDGMLEYLQLKTFTSRDCILDYFFNTISKIMEDNSGSCVLFLYSVLLTKGINKIREEMDDPNIHLIGEDEYCSQEVVNLILIGRAVTNLFDRDVVLNSGGSERTTHRGLQGESKIGLLSEFEYNHITTVGKFYKNPRYPIWVTVTVNHFTVLFGTTRRIFDKVVGECFQIFHYDELERDRGSIGKETAYTIELGPEDIFEADNNVSGIEKCIFTKWRNAIIHSED